MTRTDPTCPVCGGWMKPEYGEAIHEEMAANQHGTYRKVRRQAYAWFRCERNTAHMTPAILIHAWRPE